jgi:eukaryotic-like serine/threonine-protein kinase
MGRVLLARDPVLERNVAIKHLRADLNIPRDVRQGLVVRMRHEARAAARVSHPNLVVIHDMGEDPGTPATATGLLGGVGLYLVFEYVEGPTLKQRIAKGRLPAGDVVRLARELGAALTVAHEAGVLHRDIKPENLILARWGGKVADFGIARVPDSTLTHQGGLMGTPAYSAPETFRAGSFSPASDQFSLAASLYEALSGSRAFPGDDAVLVAAKIASDRPDPFARALGLPSSVDEVLGRALARAPAERYPSCAVFGAALAESVLGNGRRGSSDLIRCGSDPSSVGATIGLPSDPELRANDDGAVARKKGERSPTDPLALASDDALAAPPAARPSFAPLMGEVPRERKTGQVLLGAAVVVVTASLLVRTALRSSSEEAAVAPPIPSAAPLVSASASVQHPRVVVPPVRHPRTETTSAASGDAPRTSASGASSVSSPGSASGAADAGARGAPAPLPSSPSSRDPRDVVQP